MPRMVIRSRPRRGRRAARRAISVPRCREERAARRVRRPRKPSAEKLFLLLPAFAVSLGAGFTLRRVFRLRAHLVAHAIAVRVALLACAGLVGLAMRRLHLRGALHAGLGILGLGAHLLAHAVVTRVALLAFAGLFGLAVRRLHLACVGSRGLGVKGAAGDEQAGTEEGDRQFHKRVRSEEHTSELQSLAYLVCRLLLEKKKGPARHPCRTDASQHPGGLRAVPA